eukprot:491895-Prymnesium_polylepis.2
MADGSSTAHLGAQVRLYGAPTSGQLKLFKNVKFQGDMFADLPSDGEVANPADMREIQETETLMIEAYGEAVVRKVCVLPLHHTRSLAKRDATPWWGQAYVPLRTPTHCVASR